MSKQVWRFLALAGTVVFAHAPSLTRDFVWDDFRFLNQLDRTGFTGLLQSDLLGFIRPGKKIYFSFFYELFGRQVIFWNLLGLLGILIASILLYQLTCRFLKENEAFVASVTYSLHPLHVEGSCWISAVNGLWATIFGLAYYLVLTKPFAISKKRIWIYSTAFFAAAIGMKEEAVSLPVLAWIFSNIFSVFSVEARVSNPSSDNQRKNPCNHCQPPFENTSKSTTSSLNEAKRQTMQIREHHDLGNFQGQSELSQGQPDSTPATIPTFCTARILPNPANRSMWKICTFHLILSIAFLLWTRNQSLTQGQALEELQFSSSSLTLLAPGNLLQHLAYFFYPFHWGYFDYGILFYAMESFWSVAAIGFLGLVSITILLGLRAEKREFWLFVLATFSLVPMMNFFKLGNNYFGVRYLLHAGCFLSMAIGCLWNHRFLRPLIFTWLIAIALSSCFFHSYWKNDRELFSQILQVNKLAWVYDGLCEALLKNKEWKRTISVANEGLNNALTFGPSQMRMKQGLLLHRGIALQELGNNTAALNDWQNLEKLQPENIELLANLGAWWESRFETTTEKNDSLKAQEYYRRASQGSGPNSENSFNNLGRLQAINGGLMEAAKTWEEGLTKFPRSKILAINLSQARTELRKYNSSRENNSPTFEEGLKDISNSKK
ncbi:MAG: glycosyltransferase family 39 protein [Candidatus Riflebacteria bacterium]|nr:glycosyltransferase family 39 protein [Candidatus Riflebacteria bacterium]